MQLLFYQFIENSTGITSVSKDFLPATTLAEDCYYNMFDTCTSLTKAPALPATTLADGCYTSMFMLCTSLMTAPELPATTLAYHCYVNMFRSCTSLSSIKIGYTGNYNESYFKYWVRNVASTGTFYYKGGDSLENFGFPSTGWNINSDWN